MKTNGEADSSQVSGNCRGKEAKERQDQFSAMLRRGCMGKTLNLKMPGAAVMNHSVSVRVYTSCETSSVSNVMLDA